MFKTKCISKNYSGCCNQLSIAETTTWIKTTLIPELKTLADASGRKKILVELTHNGLVLEHIQAILVEVTAKGKFTNQLILDLQENNLTIENKDALEKIKNELVHYNVRCTFDVHLLVELRQNAESCLQCRIC